MSASYSDNQTDFAARAVEAEDKAAAAAEAQRSARWQRVATFCRRVALVRLQRGEFFDDAIGTDAKSAAAYDDRSVYLIRRNRVLIAAATRARSDCEQSQLRAYRARVVEATEDGLRLCRVPTKIRSDRELSVFKGVGNAE